MSESMVLKLRLALMGRPVRNYTFDKPLITVGRDPESDVFVDNPGVSRDHFRLERTPAGEYQVVDLGSANGTFLNDQMVNTALVRNNDVVRFGKYTLWVGYDQDRRTVEEHPRRDGAESERHTIVLSRSELGHVLDASREKGAPEPVPAPASGLEPAPALAPAFAPAPHPVRHRSASASFLPLFVAFLLGAALGAGVVWLLLNR